MDITRTGFGSWAAGGGGGWAFSWGPQDDEQSISAIRHAVDSGVNWVDTAPVYGLGHSEEVVAAVYSPMQAGLLTGAFTAERVASLHNEDWRGRDAQFQGERLQRNLALTDALRPIAAGRGISLATLAVAWTLSWPGVSGAIVGARDNAQVDGWLPAAEVELTPAELDQVAAAIEATGAGEGPVRPNL